MKKYYFKKSSNTIWSNDPNISNTRKVKDCYSAYFANTAPDKWANGYAAPWFCLKDGQYPIYKLLETNPVFEGFRRICDFTVSSLSSQYYLTTTTSNEPNVTYKVPFYSPYVNKVDLYLNDENIFEDFNPHNGNKLLWKMNPELIKLFQHSDVGPNYWDSSSGFIVKNSMKGNPSNLPKDISGWFDKDRPSVDGSSAMLGNYKFMNFSNINAIEMVSGNNTISGTFYSSTNGVPPHYSIKVSDFDSNITGIKVKINGLFLYSDFNYHIGYFQDNSYINNSSTFDNGNISPNCLAFFYQINNSATWDWDSEDFNTTSKNYLNGNFSGTVDFVPGGSGNKLKCKEGVNIESTTYCLNNLYKLENQNISTEDFWNHSYVYSVNTNTNNLYKFKYKPTGLTGYTYLSSNSVGDRYEITAITAEQYTDYNLTGKQFFSEVSAFKDLDTTATAKHNDNKRFIIYADSSVNNVNRYYKAYTLHYYANITSTADSTQFISLTSNNPDYETIYGNEESNPVKYCWTAIGNSPIPSETYNTNYQFSNVKIEYTIPIDYTANSGKYIHISSPATTVLVNESIPNHGLVLEYILSYEGVS